MADRIRTPAAMKVEKNEDMRDMSYEGQMRAWHRSMHASIDAVWHPPKKQKCYHSKSGKMTAADAYSNVAESVGLKPKDVKAAVEGLLGLAAAQVKKNGSFKMAGMLNLKLKIIPAVPARKGVNPFTKEPCLFKARQASKTARALPMKKLKDMVN